MRKHFIYLSLIPISFFMFICNAKAIHSDYTEYSAPNHICLKKQYNFNDLDVYCVNENNVATLNNQEQPTADENINFNGKLTSCEELDKDGYQCYSEETTEYNGLKYYFKSLGPKIKEKRKIDNGDGTYNVGNTNKNGQVKNIALRKVT